MKISFVKALNNSYSSITCNCCGNMVIKVIYVLFSEKKIEIEEP